MSTEKYNNELPTEYEHSESLKSTEGHVWLYPDEQHGDYIHGISCSFKITPALQEDIDRIVAEWLPNDLPTIVIDVKATGSEDSGFIMFYKYIVNFSDVSNRISQYVMARATDHNYRKIHSYCLGEVEYMDIQENGVGFIRNYVANMNFSQKLGKRKHSSFLTATPIPVHGEKQEVHE